MDPENPDVASPVRPSAVTPVSLRDVAAHLGVVDQLTPGHRVEVTGVAQSSRHVRPGDLYVARSGGATHGARYLTDAEAAGACAWLTDRQGASMAAGSSLPMLVVDDPRRRLGSTAAMVYGHPTEALTVIGVTGTQGKTTTTQLVEAGLAGAGRRTAVIGTMGTRIAGRAVASSLTTPEAPDLQALFAVMREEDIEVCAMEVSSHALVSGRVDGVVFDLAAFTNFGRDHLDFHGSVEEYFAAKASLFTPARAARGLVNSEDREVARLLDGAEIPLTTYATSGGDAEWTGSEITTTHKGSSFVLSGPRETRVDATIALAGTFNVSNAVCALACIGEIGGDVAAAAEGISALAGVPGRMEPVECGQSFAVIVDYAHKPDALAATLLALREVTTGRLLLVIGAGGDRDQGKRPLMGEVAAQNADVVVVTDDNPRTEEPSAIRDQLMAGAVGAATDAELHEIADREAAITFALNQARRADTVLIAGKGHETGQEIGGAMHPFDDRTVAAAVLERGAKAGPT